MIKKTSLLFGVLSFINLTCYATLYVVPPDLNNAALLLPASGGIDYAQADINGAFFTADMSVGQALPCLPCSPYLSFNLRYAELFLGTYTETGSFTNLTVNNRNIGLITTRLEAAFWSARHRGFFEPFIGVFGRYQVVGTGVQAVLLNQSIFFDQEGPLNLVAGLVGLRGVQRTGLFKKFFNIEASFDNASSTRILGELGVKF